MRGPPPTCMNTITDYYIHIYTDSATTHYPNKKYSIKYVLITDTETHFGTGTKSG